MDILLTLILVLISLVIGFLLSVLINNWRGVSRDERKQGKARSKIRREVARLWRDQRHENLLVEIDERIYKAAGELTPGQRQRLISASSDLRTWLGIIPPTVQSPEPEQEAMLNQTGSPGAAADWAESPLPLAEPQGESERVSLNPFKVFTQAYEETTPETPSASIAAQIDEILQEKLENSPLQERGIRLVDQAGEGITVMVGLDRYDSVEAVPEPVIRAIIREAVAEWEARAVGRY